MTVVDDRPTSQRAPWAKKRILETATELFYEQGIRTVGVDLLISKSEVTKATFYKHYRAKENLVLAYVTERHRRDMEYVEELVRSSANPADVISTITNLIVAELQKPHFRGCLFLNAASEYSDATHPVRAIVVTHRDWYTEVLRALFSDLGHPLPGEAADEFILARDGAMIGSYASDPVAAAGAFQRSVARILAETTA